MNKRAMIEVPTREYTTEGWKSTGALVVNIDEIRSINHDVGEGDVGEYVTILLKPHCQDLSDRIHVIPVEGSYEWLLGELSSWFTICRRNQRTTRPPTPEPDRQASW